MIVDCAFPALARLRKGTWTTEDCAAHDAFERTGAAALGRACCDTRRNDHEFGAGSYSLSDARRSLRSVARTLIRLCA
jgi:hypothetical protein